MNSTQAKQIRIDEYLARLGHLPKKVSPQRLVYTSMLSDGNDSTPSFQVTPDGHAFHDWSSGQKGSIVDLAMAILGTNSVSEALAHIEETMGLPSTTLPTKSFSFHQQNKIEILSADTLNAPALLRYAQSRGIHPTVATSYCAEVHYRTASGKEYYSIGWKNNSDGWELRNAYGKVAAAPKDVTLVNDLCECPYLVFEGFFDFLSAAQLRWFRPDEMNAVVLNSNALVERALPLLGYASRIICLLDNDASGKRTTARIREAYPHVEDRSDLYVGYNDLNDALCAMNDSRYK